MLCTDYFFQVLHIFIFFQLSSKMFYGRRNAALEDEQQAAWIAPLDAEGSDYEDNHEDSDDNDPPFIPDDDDLSQDEECEQPSTSRRRRG